MLHKHVKSLVAVGLALTVIAANLITPIAFTSNYAVHAQDPSIPLEGLKALLEAHGVDFGYFMSLVARAKANGGDVTAFADVFHGGMGVSRDLTMPQILDRIGNMTYQRELDSLGLTRELISALPAEMDKRAGNQFYSTYGLDKARLENTVSTLDITNKEAAMAQTGLTTELELASFLDQLDSIDAFDELVKTYGLEDAFSDYMSEMDGALVLEYYGWDEATLNEILAAVYPANPDRFIEAALTYGFDAYLLNEVVTALEDDALFLDALVALGIDLDDFEGMIHEMVLDLLLLDYDLTLEELEAILADPEAAEALGLDADDLAVFIDEADDEVTDEVDDEAESSDEGGEESADDEMTDEADDEGDEE